MLILWSKLKKRKQLLGEMLGLSTQAALIRSRFQSAELMDAPSKFLFFFQFGKKEQSEKMHSCLAVRDRSFTN